MGTYLWRVLVVLGCKGLDSGGGKIIMLGRISLANHWEQSWKRNNPMKTFENFGSHILHPKDCWSDGNLPLEGHGSAWLQRHGVIGGGMIIMLDRISLSKHWEESWKRNNPMKTFEICFTHLAL